MNTVLPTHSDSNVKGSVSVNILNEGNVKRNVKRYDCKYPAFIGETFGLDDNQYTFPPIIR